MTQFELIKTIIEIQEHNLQFALKHSAAECRQKITKEVNEKLPVGITPFTEEKLLQFMIEHKIFNFIKVK